MATLTGQRAEFDRRVAAARDALGDQFDHLSLIAEFVDRGVSRASAWRWWQATNKAAAPKPDRPARPAAAAAAAKPPRQAKAARAASPPMVVDGVGRKLPPIPKVEDVQTRGLLPVLELLRDCITIAQDMIEHSRTADGKVRNARLLLQASEHLRRAIETAAKLNETVAIQKEMQAFHRIVMEEVGREAAPVQQRILARVKAACDTALADG